MDKEVLVQFLKQKSEEIGEELKVVAYSITSVVCIVAVGFPIVYVLGWVLIYISGLGWVTPYLNSCFIDALKSKNTVEAGFILFALLGALTLFVSFIYMGVKKFVNWIKDNWIQAKKNVEWKRSIKMTKDVEDSLKKISQED